MENITKEELLEKIDELQLRLNETEEGSEEESKIIEQMDELESRLAEFGYDDDDDFEEDYEEDYEEEEEEVEDED